MVKYYFFEIKQETNASGQLRKVVYPLANQTTYATRFNQNDSVVTTRRVQLDITSNGYACRLPIGSIIGIAREGHQNRDMKLSVQNRNNVSFYRIPDTIYFVHSDSGINTSPVSGLLDGSAEMMHAYEQLVQGNAGTPSQIDSDSDSEIGADAILSNLRDHFLSGDERREDLAKVVVSRTNELRVIEDNFRSEESEQRVINRVLQMSKLRDRMVKGIAKFSYFKQNGEHRVAYGTRNRQLIDSLRHEAGYTNESGNSTPDGEHFYYFDVQRGGWRNFCIHDFDELEEDFLVISAASAQAIQNIEVAVA